MSASTAVIHSVQFYERDEALIARLANILSSAIESGNSSVVIATPEHRSQLWNALDQRTAGLTSLQADGRLNLLDADETLGQFMVDGTPDQELFVQSVGKVVMRAKSLAWNAHRGLTAFGEMVALLWQRGNHVGALQLESLWNELLNEHAFHLHCAYPKSLFTGAYSRSLMAAVCDAHSHVLGQEAA